MTEIAVRVSAERLEEFSGSDLEDLCDATEGAILDGGGFGWVTPPARHVLEAYWRGVLLVPERHLFVGRLDGTIAAAAQTLRPARNNEAQAFALQLTGHFVAPWARGHGLARAIVVAAEQAARAWGFRSINLDVRDSQSAAIKLYESLGYVRWGTHPYYARVEGDIVAGHFYYKNLSETEAPKQEIPLS
ncbi:MULTISPECIES: GNAT family N-acetyltransferase [Oceanibaculum]|uniref:Ribosomal protein S18 acetylase RimI-like enzyme n=1 Tax=Oceanibaculum indicum TaxID=526216 RepID=A0A420WCC2_9PROT|nr:MULTISPECIES: GNAT family N-acetyltransferase [Oceanibaculum]MCH2393551.1 GNAT family N-acetyltransferase [Oceanibaculum sp.]RKQ68661.1 ribosomal protein S18 acetylase RimI-like enzyme [Oceanibaculum indicum]